jgi:hypothetical protein
MTCYLFVIIKNPVRLSGLAAVVYYRLHTIEIACATLREHISRQYDEIRPAFFQPYLIDNCAVQKWLILTIHIGLIGRGFILGLVGLGNG